MMKIFKTVRDKGLRQLIRDLKSSHHYDTNVWLDQIRYDQDNNRYVLQRRTLKADAIPPDALKVTGEKNHYAVVECEKPVRVIKREDGFLETCAISNYLYMINNSINDALASVWKPRYINTKLLMILGIGGAIIVYLIVTKVSV